MNLAIIRAKSNANYACQQCESKDFIQGHHKIPGDDSTIIVLCGTCHSQKHPNVPQKLFFSHNHQPYWFNKAAASLAKELSCHSRTIIRAAKRLRISPGELRAEDEQLIKNQIGKYNHNKKYPTPFRNLIRLGNSRAIIIPSDWLKHQEDIHGKKIDYVLMRTLGDAITIAPHL